MNSIAAILAATAALAAGQVGCLMLMAWAQRRATRHARILDRLNRGFKPAPCDCEVCTHPTETSDAFHLALWAQELEA